jgi:hypothetical protein
MDEEWTETLQWESELLEEAFLNLFPSSGQVSSDFDMPGSPPWQDFSFFPEPQMNYYNTSYGSLENMPAVENHTLDMMSSEYADSTFQNPIPCPDDLDKTLYQDLAFPPTLSAESARSVTPSLKSTYFEACLHTFDGGPKTVPPRRKRRPFSTERRKEVSQVRKVGACIRCKLTKSSVSTLSFMLQDLSN